MNKFDKKISGKGVVRAGKEFILFISNEDMNHVIRIRKSLEDSGVLIDGGSETIQHEIEKQEGDFFGASLAPFSSFISKTSNFFISKRYKWKRS